MTQIPPYPLAWPDGVPRCTARTSSAFRTNLTGAIENVSKSLRLFAADSGRKLEDVQITSNVGLMSGRPSDPGIAVWFTWDGGQRCIAVDRYQTVHENLQAVHHVLEARRTEMRHAGIEIARAAFRGFTAALPAPGVRRWWDVLGVAADADLDAIDAAYKARARAAAERHDEASLKELNIARDAARKARAGAPNGA